MGTHVRHEIATRIDRLAADALEAITTAPITDEARTELIDLADFVAGRNY